MPLAFQPDGRPVLIGSLPLDDHDEAAGLVSAHTPEIPLWVQLPVHPQERMIPQFLPGMPGLTGDVDSLFIDTATPQFETQLLQFYEDYVAVTEGGADLDTSRFGFAPDVAPGFFKFLTQVAATSAKPLALKGQVTGPVTLTTGVKDQDGRAIYYDDRTRDAAVKLLAQKARWQAVQLRKTGYPAMVFFDEPALAGFGSSAFISISKEAIAEIFAEVIGAVHAEDALAGIHVCANTEWSLILDSAVDVVSFDAYAYFDRFVLYPDLVRRFLADGGFLAWGIVPTASAEEIDAESADSLFDKWKDQARQIIRMGFDFSTVRAQTLISPSCGTGSLDKAHALKVLSLTRDLAAKVRGLEGL